MNAVKVGIKPRQRSNVSAQKPKPVQAGIGGVSVTDSKDYNDLHNKPSVNGVTLQGEMDLEDLGIANLATLEYEEVT